MVQFLAIYRDRAGSPRATMLSGEVRDLPFGTALSADQLSDLDPRMSVVLVEMPDGFRPMIVNVDSDEEMALEFADL